MVAEAWASPTKMTEGGGVGAWVMVASMAEAAPAADPPEGSAAAAVDPEVDSQWVLAAVG